MPQPAAGADYVAHEGGQVFRSAEAHAFYSWLVPSAKQTWNLKRVPLETTLFFIGLFFGFHVCLAEGMLPAASIVQVASAHASSTKTLALSCSSGPRTSLL